jgi:hypothetical protein
MERVRIILTIFFLNVLLITSCNQDFLDTKPLDEFSDADVWKDPALAKAFINGIYQNLTYDFAKYSRCIFEDDGHRRAAAAVLNFNRSMMTADIIPGWGLENWQGLFSSIRRCNLFLDRIEKADFEDKDTMIGEVKFLRAWLYHYMASLYGGIPIISKVYTLSDDFKAPRDTYEDVIKFIVEDCDQAASLLPEIQSGNNFGRPTKGAALALKSRVLLYAASDLHNTIVFPDYTNPELIGYTDK